MLSSESSEEKLELLSNLVDRTFYTKHRKTITLKYIENAESISNGALSARSEHILKYIVAWKHEHYNEFEEKIELLIDCIDYFEKQADSTFYYKSLYYLGELHFRTGRYESGLKYLSKLKEVLPGTDHWLYSIGIRKLVRTYSNLNQNETALEIISELISRYEAQPDFSWDSKNMRHYVVKGGILSRLGKTHEAISYTEKAMMESSNAGNKIILNNCKSELSKYYLSLGQHEKAKELAHQAYDHYEVLKMNYPSMTSTRVTLGNIYLEQSNYKEASRFYSEAVVLAKKHHRLLNHKEALQGLIKCNLNLGENKELLLKQLSQYDRLKDSLLNEDMNLTVQDVRIKYETEKKEVAIDQLNKQNLMAKNNLQIAKRNNLYLLAAILFLFLSAILLAYLYNNKLKAQRLLESKNRIIADSLEEKQLLLKEIHHRVKNNLQTVSSLLSLQSNYIKDEKVLKALQDGQNRVQSMALIHQNLYQDDNLRSLSIQTYFKKLISGLYQSYYVDPERIKLTLEVEDLMMDVETVIPIGLITNELVTNVFKYAFNNDEKGELKISLTGRDSYVLTVKDNGRGIDEKAKEKKGESFGFQMINAFCAKLGAELSIESKEGTEIRITIPNRE